MPVKDILDVAQTAGQIILENGGEVYRVEETMSIICRSYGIQIVESFVTPSVIMISLKDHEDNPITFIKRIKKRTIDMHKIHDINELSRRISSEKPSLEQVKSELKRIQTEIHYKWSTQIIATGSTTGCFTLLFGGKPLDFLFSFFIGASMKLLLKNADKLKMNDFFTNIIGGAFASIIALFATLLLPDLNSDLIIIGSIMILVPGLTITNGIRDTIAGDFYSGIARVLESVFVALGISLGSVIAFSVFYQIKEVLL